MAYESTLATRARPTRAKSNDLRDLGPRTRRAKPPWGDLSAPQDHDHLLNDATEPGPAKSRDHLLTLILLGQLRASIIRPKIVPRLALTLQIIFERAAVVFQEPSSASDMADEYICTDLRIGTFIGMLYTQLIMLTMPHVAYLRD